MHIFVGWDHRTGGKMADRCCAALDKFEIKPTVLREHELRSLGLYEREYKTISDGRMFDNGDFKEFPEHYTFTKFLAPHLCSGFALFIAPSLIFKEDPRKVFGRFDETKVVSAFPWTETKGNFDHKAVLFNSAKCVERLSIEEVNHRSASHLNEFKWCKDGEVGVFGLDLKYFTE